MLVLYYISDLKFWGWVILVAVVYYAFFLISSPLTPEHGRVKSTLYPEAVQFLSLCDKIVDSACRFFDQKHYSKAIIISITYFIAIMSISIYEIPNSMSLDKFEIAHIFIMSILHGLIAFSSIFASVKFTSVMQTKMREQTTSGIPIKLIALRMICVASTMACHVIARALIAGIADNAISSTPDGHTLQLSAMEVPAILANRIGNFEYYIASAILLLPLTLALVSFLTAITIYLAQAYLQIQRRAYNSEVGQNLQRHPEAFFFLGPTALAMILV